MIHIYIYVCTYIYIYIYIEIYLLNASVSCVRMASNGRTVTNHPAIFMFTPWKCTMQFANDHYPVSDEFISLLGLGVVSTL